MSGTLSDAGRRRELAPEAEVTLGTSDRPVFVVGCPRSGTTLVQLMLHSHPRIAIPPETRFLLPAYRKRLRFGDLEDERNRQKLARFIVQGGRHRIRDLGLDREETIRAIVAGPPTVGSAAGIVLREYANRFERPRWGEKRPAYHNWIGVIMRLFPDAHIVHVLRDPRACVASLKRMPWWRRGSYHAIAAWADSIDHTDEAMRKWPGAVTRIQYERLVADPEGELRTLCAALYEEYEPAMAEPERVAGIAVPERKHWHSDTRVGPTTKNVERWRDELDDWEVALAETVLSARMERLGYEPNGAGRPRAGHLLRYARVRIAKKRARRKLLVRDRVAQRSEPNPVAARLTRLQRAAAEDEEARD
jgi:hypothetical protein